MNLIEWRFAHAQSKRSFLFQGNVGRSLDQVRSVAVGDARQRAYAAGDYNHGVGRIRPAGHVGADVVVGLQLNLARRASAGRIENAADQIVSALDVQFFRHDAQRRVRSNEIYGLHPLVALDGAQQLTQEDGAAGPGRGDGQILRRMVRQNASYMRELWSIGSLPRRSQDKGVLKVEPGTRS